MATPSNVLAWRTPWTEEPGGLQSTGPQRVGHDLATRKQQQQKARYQTTWHQPLGLSLPTVSKALVLNLLSCLPASPLSATVTIKALVQAFPKLYLPPDGPPCFPMQSCGPWQLLPSLGSCG